MFGSALVLSTLFIKSSSGYGAQRSKFTICAMSFCQPVPERSRAFRLTFSMSTTFPNSENISIITLVGFLPFFLFVPFDTVSAKDNPAEPSGCFIFLLTAAALIASFVFLVGRPSNNSIISLLEILLEISSKMPVTPFMSRLISPLVNFFTVLFTKVLVSSNKFESPNRELIF